MKKDTNFLV